ncbi:hypothetical protein ACXIUT_27845 [Achromobacter denitrificans]
MDKTELPLLDDEREDRLLAWRIIGAITGLMLLGAVATWAAIQLTGA